MQCRTCGAPLPSGAAFCTNCGAATPYNLSGQAIPGAQPAAPSQYQSNNEPLLSYNPVQFPPQPGQAGIPPTVYGGPSYDAPTENDYAPPPPPPFNPYGAPYSPTPGSFIPPGQPPRRQGPKVGLIIGIGVIVLLLVAGGIIAIFATRSHPNSPTAAGVSPSGSPVDPTSATIISNAQTASAVDSNALPTNVTSTFSVRQTVYVTFNLHTNGQAGYAQAKLYSDTTYVGNKILAVQSGYDYGYFSVELNKASTGTVELYWCTQSDCSDAKLATIVTFHVS
jgi:hypothetical protein